MPHNADELFDLDDPLRCVWAEGYDPHHMPYSVGKSQITTVKIKDGFKHVTMYPVVVNGRAFQWYESADEAYYHALRMNTQCHRAIRSCIAKGVTQPHRWLIV